MFTNTAHRGRRARLASSSSRAGGQVIPQHATRWQRAWSGLQEARVRCLLWLHKSNSLPGASSVTEAVQMMDFHGVSLNPNEQNIPRPIQSAHVCVCVGMCVWVCVCVYMRMCAHVCIRVRVCL